MFLKYLPNKGLIRQTVDFTANRLKNATTRSVQVNVSEIGQGRGWLGKVQDTNVAIYNKDGQLTVLENVCTHRQCQTDWNAEEKTWDCPCHGSRYHADGSVLRGPAKRPLKKLDYTVEDGQIRLLD